MSRHVYPPIRPRLLQFEASETHLHSFIVMPVRKDRQGGGVLKVTAYFDTGVEHHMHLTNGRLVLEPVHSGTASRWAERGLLLGLGLLLGVNSVAAVVDQREKERNEADEHLRQYGEDILAIPLARIEDIQTFRQGFGHLCRLRISGLPADTIAFRLSRGVSGISGKALGSCVTLIQEACQGS